MEVPMCYRAAPRWGAAFPLLMLLACGGEDPKTPPPTGPSFATGPVLSVSVAGPSKLAVGACAPVTAAGTDVDNHRAPATTGGFILRPNFKVASVTPLDPTSFSARDTLYGQVCGIANGFTRVSAFLD